MSRRNLELAYIEWNSDGKITTILKEWPRNLHLNVLDRMADALRNPPYLVDFQVEWCKRDNMYYYQEVGAGSHHIHLLKVYGGRVKFWAPHNMEIRGYFKGKNKRGKTGTYSRKLTEGQIKRLGYDRVAEVSWTQDITVGNDMYDRPPAAEGECYWCDACEDMLPKDEPCEHTFYCTADFCDESHWQQPTHCPDHTLCKHFKLKRVAT